MKLLRIRKICLFLFLLIANISQAATVDTVSIYSNAMHKAFYCVVIKPDSYKKKKNQFPVVYLLHGFSGTYSDWIKKVPQIKNEVDQLQLLIVCPDGGYSSWYFDSPLDSSMKYETYIGFEVPAYIDAHYRTIKNRTARATTGLSMGGHGALFLSFRHADIFGACGSMSGGVDLNDSRNKFEIIKRLGDTILQADNWKKYSVINVIENRPKEDLAIIFDCGMDDFFHPGNKKLHEKMLQLKIPHDYIERPGQHDWNYWSNSVEYQLLFFRKYFDKIKTND
jgi:S-formylglutathione hydrolase FrmB